ncbi:Stk1 family PASTA domain-containing Ser/Thr kinase [Sporosarcina jiandibaonis]|uniref:Stk1 family PASTA domain-containing Ser/Thr kinase n=1 Tax=Sporosarcina jiandibaonis TaxID=2715535 RepID=UPI001556E1EA
MIGKRIGGRYEILKFIGGGGMSRVYLAHDIILDRDVAIKVLNYDFSNEEELKRRFMREALSATSLMHPHIVDIYDVGEDGDIHYLVMEYIEGQTLKEYIQSNGPLAPEQALPIMQQLVSAISNAHYNGIVHRDIKPQNILMDHDGNVKITDFGIAMALSATAYTKTNSVLGTVHYLSPEQARGGMATKKSDIYSLGIVFYELLTGKLPFSGESAVSIALKHLQEETPSVRKLFPTIPQSVENVILKATAKDAVSRYRSADEMQDDLATVLSPERANEEKFAITFDDETTRAIPAISATSKFDNVQQTKENHPVEPEEEIVEEPVKKKRKKWPIFLGIIAGLAVIGLLIMFLPALLGLNKIEVPDVSDMDEREAIDLLEEKGFIVAEDRTEQTSDEFAAGKVIRTVPEAGKERRPGTEITLYISTGKEATELTDYTGRDIEQVKGIVENMGFKSVKIDEVFDNETKGTIIKQSPEAGPEYVLSETDLVLTVSKGKEMRKLENLVGYDEQKLEEYAKSSGLNIVVTSKVHHATVGQGRIISQEPAADTMIEKGGRVEVVQSLGQEQKPIKQLIQTVTIEYVPEDPEDGEDEDSEGERKPNRIRIYIQDRKNSMADVFSDFEITEDTPRRITIELEEGQSGAYRIMRDDTQIAEETFHYDEVD